MSRRVNYRQCEATSKRTGLRCRARAVTGYSVCYHHGGASLRGAEHPNFRGKGWSVSVPDRLSERYAEARDDPERHDLRDQIALADAKIVDLLEGMEYGESDRLWIELRRKELAMRRASRRGDEDRSAELLGEILEEIRKGGDEALAWAEVDRWMHRQARAVEQDLRVAQIKHQVITIDEFMAMMGRILELIRSSIHNQDDRHRLAQGFRRELEASQRTGGIVALEKNRAD